MRSPGSRNQAQYQNSEKFFSDYQQKITNEKVLNEMSRAQKIKELEEKQSLRVKKLLADNAKK